MKDVRAGKDERQGPSVAADVEDEGEERRGDASPHAGITDPVQPKGFSMGREGPVKKARLASMGALSIEVRC
jgi:hypothetical protein